MWGDTCLILTTDHGFLLSEHDWWGKNLTPYYEEISHIPLVMHHPEFAGRAGARVSELTQTTDLMPTMLELHGQAIPPEVTGKSILEIARGKTSHEALIFGMFGGPLGVTDGEYSYFLYPDDLFNEELGEYTLMPTHMTGMFTPKELATGKYSIPFDFSKGLKLIRYDALNEARRPPGLDGTNFHPFETAVYHNIRDPNQTQPIRDRTLEARLRQHALRLLVRHDAPPEYYTWMGLTPDQS